MKYLQLLRAFYRNHFSPICALLHYLDPIVLGGKQNETGTHFLKTKKQLCAIWIPKRVFFVKVHCGCPGGFRVQRKAEGDSPHQLFNCRGSDMVWFFRKIRTSVQFIPFLQFHFFNEICFWSLIQILLTGRAQSQSVECTWGKYNSFVF